jgi:hypothetical protein
MRLSTALTIVCLLVGCGGSQKTKTKAEPDPDRNSTPDGKRSGAREIKPNVPITDEVNYANGDKTDWYMVQLKGKPGVVNSIIRWDNVNSDIMIDVFDEFGTQVAASPVRATATKDKYLLTQIDKPGTFFFRVTAPTKADGSVYTLEVKWTEPPPPAPPQIVVAPPPPAPEPERPHHHHEPRPDPPPSSTGETVEGRIVGAYHDENGGGLTLHIDKGSGAGIRKGMTGYVVNGDGVDAVDGGEFKIFQVVGDSKCLAKTSLHSIGRNTRVMIKK